MKKHVFIARMPDAPGSLHRAAEIIKTYNGNINRIQFDRRIDAGTVFYEVTATDEDFARITWDLEQIGYLQTSLKPYNFLKFAVYLPHKTGSLYEFLTFTTNAGANIALIDFDDTSRNPDRLTVSLNLEESARIEALLDQLKSRYRLEILEYDTTGRHLDDTVFYVRFAQEIRALVGESEDEFLLLFLADTNHIAQELMAQGNDPHKAFDSVLATGRTIAATTGTGFYADVQVFTVTPTVKVYCFQMPCGGSVFVIRTPGETVMIDTGYGAYHRDIMGMFARYGLGDETAFSRIYVSHADADHSGGGGLFSAPLFLHRTTIEIIRRDNRAYGSRRENSVLEEFYTKMIRVFSRFTMPKMENVRCFPAAGEKKRSIFPVLDTIRIGDLELEVLESLGGHTVGQVYFYSARHGLLFAADSIINFASLTPERSTYNSLADFLVSSVNVDSDLARQERKALTELVRETDKELSGMGRRCLVCGGHGAVSVLDGDKLVPAAAPEHYEPRK